MVGTEPSTPGEPTRHAGGRKDIATHRLDLGMIIKHDLVLVVDIVELLFGNIDLCSSDEEDLLEKIRRVSQCECGGTCSLSEVADSKHCISITYLALL